MMRPEVQEFMRACETLARVAHQNELTPEERGIVINFLRALEQEVVQASPPPTDDDAPPLAATLSNLPLID